MSFYPSRYSTIGLPVGTVAALLTSCEYILSTLAALSARAAVHGSWLYNLHRGGEATIGISARTKRNVYKDVIGSILGVWLVVAVALVESNLYGSVVVSPVVAVSPFCISTSQSFDASLFDNLVPSMRSNIEPWVFGVIETLNCEGGLATIGTGHATNLYGHKRDIGAPICDPSIVTPPEKVSIQISVLRVNSEQIVMRTAETSVFEIIPYNRQGIGLPVYRQGPRSEGQGPCGMKGISTYMVGLTHGWMTAYANSRNISTFVMETICEQHSTVVTPIAVNLTDRCANYDMNILDVACIYDGLPPNLIRSAVIHDTAAIFVGKEAIDPSYACINASIRIDYTLISPDLFAKMTPPTILTMPVLIPLHLAVQRGYCERTVHVLGRAALVYSADAEWLDTRLRKLNRRMRYHAYMVTVASAQFPLTQVNESLTGFSATPETNEPCLLKGINDVTLVPWNWCLWLLILGVSATAIVTVLGITMRLVFAGETWRVGSAQWSLSRLFSNTGLGDPMAENSVVVQVVQDDTDNWSVRSDEESAFYGTVHGSVHRYSIGITKTERSRSPIQGSSRDDCRRINSNRRGLLSIFSPRERRVKYRVSTPFRSNNAEISNPGTDVRLPAPTTNSKDKKEELAPQNEVSVGGAIPVTGSLSLVRLRSKSGGAGSSTGAKSGSDHN